MSGIMTFFAVLWAVAVMVYAFAEWVRGKVPWYIFVIIVMLFMILTRVMRIGGWL